METGRPFNELLQHYAIERFLYRVSQSDYSGQMTLKGAMSFRVINGSHQSRPTKDVDFQANIDNSPETVRNVLREILSQTYSEDGITFDPESVEVSRIVEDANYSGVRGTFKGNLGNAVIHMQTDIAFGDRIVPEPKTVEFPVILDGLPHPSLPCYPPETMIAQKFEAMVKLGELNSRIRDFYDIWFLMHVCEFDGQILSDAIRETFEHRKTVLKADFFMLLEKFASNPDKEKMYIAFVKRSQISNAPASLSNLADDLMIFLEPICLAVLQELPFNKHWALSNYWT